MKKVLLIGLLLTTAHSFFSQALQTENFDALTVGNVGTDITGTTAGQGSWKTNILTGSTNASNAMFQVVTNDATQVKVLQITGSDTYTGSRFMWKDGLDTSWAARTAGNDIIQAEVDFYTGPTTTSKNILRLYIYDSTKTKVLAGIMFAQDTKVVSGVGYYDATAGGGSIANYAFYLGASSTNLTLTANTWVRVGIAFNKTTGDIYWKGPGFNGYVTGAALGIDPNQANFIVSGGGTATAPNTLAAPNLFDNLSVTAVATVNLLGVSEASANFNSSFVIYPNPTTDYINIKTDQKILSVNAVDMSGKKVNVSFKNNVVDVTSLPKGIYLLNIVTPEGTSTQKFIKK